jgi:hypothetical protein
MVEVPGGWGFKIPDEALLRSVGEVGSDRSNGYVRLKFDDVPYSSHRLVGFMCLEYGQEWPIMKIAIERIIVF